MNKRIHAMTVPAGVDIRKVFADLDEGKCPHCHQEVTQRQVGHCVYGSCGHRLYQGKADPRFIAKQGG